MSDVIAVVGPPDAPLTRALAGLVELSGGTPELVTPADALPGRERCASIVIADTLIAGGESRAAAVLCGLSSRPLLMYGLGPRGELANPIRDIYGLRLELAAPAGAKAYRFAGDALLGPFAGVTLSEASERELPTIHAADGRLQVLAGCHEGPVWARALPEAYELFITTAAGWPGGPPALLRDAFCPARFMDALPVLAFARHALRGRAWTRPRAHANAVVDDPNLRQPFYGHLDYRKAAWLADQHDFHLTVGFVPLDYRTSSPQVAAHFRQHAGRLSLVMHGNDHRKRELAKPVSKLVADFAVRQALARMERHRVLTGLACPPVMTLPHGAGSRLWIRALRDAGYTAAIASRAWPFAEDPAAGAATSLHEMRPAELSLHGFPVISRFALEAPLERLLFAAWLGKPICVYTHHDFFTSGWDRFLAAVAFINEHIKPDWVDVDELTKRNYLLRVNGGTAEVRAFSNEVRVQVPPGVERVLVAKCADGLPWESETASLGGRPVEPARLDAEGIEIGPLTERLEGALHIRFGPPRPEGPVAGWRRHSTVSRARRTLTEARDRLSPLMS